MSEKELKAIRNLQGYNKLKNQKNVLIIIMFMQFICLVCIAITIINIIFNYSILSTRKFNAILSLIGILSILIFFVISKSIAKLKENFKNNYYDTIMLPIIKKVDSNWLYVENDNISEIFRDYISSGFHNTNFDKFLKESSINGKINDDINIQIHQIKLIDIIGYGRYRKIKKVFNGIFTIVDAKLPTYLEVFIRVNATSIKGNTFLNNVNIKKMIEKFFLKTSLNFDLAIKNGKIYFKIFSEDKFKEHLFRNLTDDNIMLDYYYTLKCIKEISNEIIRSNYN